MPFDKVAKQIDFSAQERDVLAFWDKIHAFDKLRAQNAGKPRWSFLDGPITANNPMGVHHAWGRTYKDAFQRYFAMTGHELRYQNGFDCQGLWVEVEVEKELKLKSKRDIENLIPGDTFASIDKFVQNCKDRVDKFARVQTDQSIRLGYWMDWDRTDADWAKPAGERKSYFTMSEENNYTIWTFLKKCHSRGLVYRGYDAMPWCPRCAVGLSQMEMHEGYQMVAHRSVFVKFPLRGRPGENLLVWTTTPWTLSSNVAAAVHPELTYLKVKHKDEVFILAKGAFTAQRLEEQFKRKEWVEGVPKLKTLEQHFKEKGGYEVLGEVKGADLVGLQYDGPFDELEAQHHPGGFPHEIAEVVVKQKWGPAEPAQKIHRVVPWDMVGEAEGTGIVHIAPGCGKEDFLLGKSTGLVPIAPLDDFGVFLPGFGPLSGKAVLDHATTDWILDNLQQKNRLFAVEKYPHNYPHCWRCKTELLFRLVDEWYIDMKWRDEIMRVTEQVEFLPESINGKARELDWLKNMGDWMISKKRFWGLALPIWVDDKTGEFEVIGSREELKARAVEGWDKFEGHSPHRPWIDLVKIRNAKTGNLMSRVPDVGNPWLDAGIVPYSTMGYNHDRACWQKWFPAAFITESFPGQFRNWFYAILAMSTMMENKPPFMKLLGHGLVRDQWGDDMHKSKGNSIPFEGAADGLEMDDAPCRCYEIKHELKSGEQKVVPGAISVKVLEETRGGQKVSVLQAVCPPMSADLMRWMYCRQNPAGNINFGPGPAEELRNKFTMKIWNSFAFFCNSAHADGFELSAPQVPVSDRPDIDRWILSDLQLLIKKARESFESFDVMTFCLAAEEFVDDKLSNWYVRRNRRRYWKSEKGADKLAAYQTLHTTLLTLTQLVAPIMPFLAETMYQKLKGTDAKESVHLTSFPAADESLIDKQLSDDMEALLRLVTLARSVRGKAKIGVRQPLAELKVQPGSDADRRAVVRFPDQITDELNLKKVTLHEPSAGALVQVEVKLNPKAAGPKFGARLKDVQKAMQAATVDDLQAGKSITLTMPDGSLATVEPTDVWITPRDPDGFAGLVDKGTQFLLDARITPELAREGMAREVIRFAQNARKDADLDMADRIVLYLQTADAELSQAIVGHRDYIGAETLTVNWADKPLGGGAFHAEVKIDDRPMTIELKKNV